MKGESASMCLVRYAADCERARSSRPMGPESEQSHWRDRRNMILGFVTQHVKGDGVPPAPPGLSPPPTPPPMEVGVDHGMGKVPAMGCDVSDGGCLGTGWWCVSKERFIVGW